MACAKEGKKQQQQFAYNKLRCLTLRVENLKNITKWDFFVFIFAGSEENL